MTNTKIRSPVERVALSVSEAAQSMSVSENTLRDLIKSRPDFPVVQVSQSRKIIPIGPLREWLAKEATS